MCLFETLRINEASLHSEWNSKPVTLPSSSHMSWLPYPPTSLPHVPYFSLLSHYFRHTDCRNAAVLIRSPARWPCFWFELTKGNHKKSLSKLAHLLALCLACSSFFHSLTFTHTLFLCHEPSSVLRLACLTYQCLGDEIQYSQKSYPAKLGSY